MAITKEDYHQVFEETIMSLIEGLVTHSKNAEIKDLKAMLNKWCEFYENKDKEDDR